jgi:hypothetical protein
MTGSRFRLRKRDLSGWRAAALVEARGQGDAANPVLLRSDKNAKNGFF